MRKLSVKIIIFTVLALGIESLCYAVLKWSGRLIPESETAEPEAHSEAHFKLEFASRWMPFKFTPYRIWTPVILKAKPLVPSRPDLGPMRPTTHLQCSAKAPKTIWLFGASVAWGWGNERPDTLASQLEKRLNQDSGGCYRVYNFGVPSYAQKQSLILLTEVIHSVPPPNHILFFDGPNDMTVASYGKASAYGHYWDEKVEEALVKVRRKSIPELARDLYHRVCSLSYTYQLAQRSRVYLLKKKTPTNREPLVDPNELATQMVGHYNQNAKIIQALAHSVGASATVIWHPTPHCNDKKADSAYPRMCELGEQMSRKETAFLFWGRKFDAHQATQVYSDNFHFSTLGNQIMADSIARQLLGTKGLL